MASMSTWPTGEDAAIVGMEVSWDEALVCRQPWQHGILLSQAHTAIPAPSLWASAEETTAPHRCLKKFVSMSVTFFLHPGLHRWTAEIHLCIGMGLPPFFSFLNTFLAAKETWCRKSSSDSLHMSPVAKETTEDACRPPCRALKCSCALGGLRSTWVKRLWRKQNCYFSFCLISWRSLTFSV